MSKSEGRVMTHPTPPPGLKEFHDFDPIAVAQSWRNKSRPALTILASSLGVTDTKHAQALEAEILSCIQMVEDNRDEVINYGDDPDAEIDSLDSLLSWVERQLNRDTEAKDTPELEQET